MSILTSRFREAVSKLKDFRMKEESSAHIAYPTGFLNFDFMNGTVVHVKSDEREFKYYSIGIPDGCCIMVIGRSGSGKSTWAVQTAANIIKPFPNGSIFHDDLEGGVTEYRKSVITGWSQQELETKYITRDTGVTAENFFERVKIVCEEKIQNRKDYEYDTGLYDEKGNRIYKLTPTIYILDSVALLMPGKYTEEDELSGSMSATAAAKTNSQIFKRIVPDLKASNVILIMVNHITTKIDINPYQATKSQVSYLKQGEELPGGKTIVYLSNVLLRFDDNTKLKEEKDLGINGILVDITTVKSRNSRAGQTCTLVFDYERGFDPDWSLFIMLKNAKLITNAGASFYLTTAKDMKFSQKDFKNKLKSDEAFRNAFIDLALDYLIEDLEKRDHFEEQFTFESAVSNDILSRLNPMAA